MGSSNTDTACSPFEGDKRRAIVPISVFASIPSTGARELYVWMCGLRNFNTDTVALGDAYMAKLCGVSEREIRHRKQQLLQCGAISHAKNPLRSRAKTYLVTVFHEIHTSNNTPEHVFRSPAGPEHQKSEPGTCLPVEGPETGTGVPPIQVPQVPSVQKHDRLSWDNLDSMSCRLGWPRWAIVALRRWLSSWRDDYSHLAELGREHDLCKVWEATYREQDGTVNPHFVRRAAEDQLREWEAERARRAKADTERLDRRRESEAARTEEVTPERRAEIRRQHGFFLADPRDGAADTDDDGGDEEMGGEEVAVA